MKKVLLSVCMAMAAMTVSAQNFTVLKTETLPRGNKMLTVKDAQGRIYRQLVKPTTYKAAAAPAPVKAASASDDIVTFYEGFENFREAYGMDWIPGDWTEKNTPDCVPTEKQLEYNANNSWYVYTSADYYQDLTTDGKNDCFIHYAYVDDMLGLKASEQDEWLITPEISLASNETLHFLLQADYWSVYETDDFDWDKLAYPKRDVVNTMKVMLTEDDGANWTEVWDLEKDVTSKLTDRQCYDKGYLSLSRQKADLSAYAGKNVKLAFRYWRAGGERKGNSMIIDSVTISHPSPAGIENVKANGQQSGVTEYFTSNGMRLSASKPTAKGLYIERKNGVARKVVVK